MKWCVLRVEKMGISLSILTSLLTSNLSPLLLPLSSLTSLSRKLVIFFSQTSLPPSPPTNLVFQAIPFLSSTSTPLVSLTSPSPSLTPSVLSSLPLLTPPPLPLLLPLVSLAFSFLSLPTPVSVVISELIRMVTLYYATGKLGFCASVHQRYGTALIRAAIANRGGAFGSHVESRTCTNIY